MKSKKTYFVIASLLVLITGYARAHYAKHELVLPRKLRMEEADALRPEFLLVEDGVFVAPTHVETSLL